MESMRSPFFVVCTWIAPLYYTPPAFRPPPLRAGEDFLQRIFIAIVISKNDNKKNIRQQIKGKICSGILYRDFSLRIEWQNNVLLSVLCFICFALLQHDRFARPFTARVIEVPLWRHRLIATRRAWPCHATCDLLLPVSSKLQEQLSSFIFHLSSFIFHLYSVICTLYSIFSSVLEFIWWFVFSMA